VALAGRGGKAEGRAGAAGAAAAAERVRRTEAAARVQALAERLRARAAR